MKKLFSAVALAAVFAVVMLAGPAYASSESEGNGNGCRNRCGDTTNNYGDTVNKGGKGGTGVGIGIGIGKGGSARASSNSEASSESTSRSNSSSRSSSYQGQDQGQSQVGINVQKGSVKNVGPQVVITETYETSASSAIAPNVNTAQLRVECPLFVQDGVSLGGSIVQGAGSFGITNSEIVKPCVAWLAAGKMTGEPQALAVISAYCLSFEAISVKNALCVDWRRKVELGGAYAPAAIDAGAYAGNEGNTDRS